MAERVNQHLCPIIGSNIRRLRKERKMKATEVIAKLQLRDVNVTTGIFSKVENGYNNPSVLMLIALTEIFHCDFNEFFKIQTHSEATVEQTCLGLEQLEKEEKGCP